MKTLKTTPLLLALLVALPASAATRALLPAAPQDMVPTTLQPRAPAIRNAIPAAAIPQVTVERAPVSVSWALPHDQPLQSLARPFARDSREYWIDVSATELQRGVSLPLSAPGALIRISPSDAVGGRLQPKDMRLKLGRRSLAADQATSLVAGTQALRAAGMSLPEASLVMRLKPELGSGMATLQAPGASGRYVVHVFEPQSPYTVDARGDRDDLLLGNAVHVRVAMHGARGDLPLVAAGGFLRAPDGHTTLLDYQRQADGSFAVDAQPRDIPRTPGLWELHSFTVGTAPDGQEVRRDTTTVFAAAAADARLDGTAAIHRAGGQGIAVALGIQAVSASRYAVSGVLYGRDRRGRLVPAAFAQSAAWLRPGRHQLVLRYDPDSLHGVGAPYELRDVRLQDQPAVALIERRALALRFDTP